jgi:U6 snRNA-associated Sm-like protein LSm6
LLALLSISNTQGEAVEQNKRSPSDFLKDVLGRPVNVRLNSGTDYRGVLACLDGYMNIAMEQTEEYVDGQLKSKYGDCFIRGNNGTFYSALLCCALLRCNISDHIIHRFCFDSTLHLKSEEIVSMSRLRLLTKLNQLLGSLVWFRDEGRGDGVVDN